MRSLIVVSSLAALVVGAIADIPALAADRYPSKPLRMIVGFPPGGGADTTARVVAERLTGTLGQQVIVDNRPGASGNIATERAAYAPADGYTMLMGSIAALAVNVSIYRKLSFDPISDFAPVTRATSSSNVLVVHPSVPARNVNELVALAKSKPQGLSFASTGVGSAGFLAAVLFNSMLGVKMVHVPYKGGGPGMLALLIGEVDLTFAPSVTAVPQFKAGKVRAIAVTSTKRSRLLPEIPTVAEATGVHDYEAYAWFGILVPAKTPQAIVSDLNREIVSVLNLNEVKETLSKQGLEVSPTTPEQFGAYIKSEIVKWAKVIKSSRAEPR